MTIFCLHSPFAPLVLFLPPSEGCIPVPAKEQPPTSSSVEAPECLLVFQSRDTWASVPLTTFSTFLCFDECVHEIRISILVVIYWALLLFLTIGAFLAVDGAPLNSPPRDWVA